MRNLRREGFTLIEIMAVVLIIGLLTTLVGIAIIPQIDKGRVTTARTQMKNLEAALESYRMDTSQFPSSEQGLDALINPPPDARNAQPGGYLRERRIPIDPWGNPYQYESPGQHNQNSFDLWSWGSDGTPGGDGTKSDIGNWVDDAEGTEGA
jgi:general secretion pathway protein G